MHTKPDEKRPKPYRVGIDARLVYQTGVGVYIRNLILYLSKTPDKQIEFHIYARSKDIVSLKDQLSAPPKDCNFVFHITHVSWHSLAEQIIFLMQLWGDKLDLMHFPYFSWPVLYFRPFVATVHDTILLTHATGKASTRWFLIYWIKNFVFRFVLSQQVRRAITVIVPSHAVEKELANFFPHAKGKIEVAYEGVDKGFIESQPTPIERLHDTQFFLYVGNCYPHKNVETLLQAFEKLVKNHPDVYLCLVGPQNNFSESIRSWVFKNNLQRYVLQFHNVPSGELKWLYSNAKALIFPSKMEGFGLPIIEAATCECPMILSDIPVFHEVIGGQAPYFDLYDTEKLTKLMHFALHETERKTYEINPKFSFETMTQEILQIYERALRGR